jgi:site-specific DNA-methyltransferase (adenine-specific)
VTPYYQDSKVTIYHGDCREVLPTLSAVDLLLTDPPFFMPVTHYASRVEWAKSWGDLSILWAWWGLILDTAKPRMKPTASAAVFCDGPSYAVFYPEIYRRFDQVRSLVWDKCHFGMGHQWRKQHELLIVGRFAESKWTGPKNLPDILRAKTVPSDDRQHPVDKQDAILRQLIEPLTEAGDTVLDPFCGGGSTLFAAKQLGRNAVGVEIEERYCELAARRCSQEMDFHTANKAMRDYLFAQPPKPAILEGG